MQIVFAVKGRQNLIPSSKRETLHKYIAGIVANKGQKLLAVFAMPDHVHLLIGLKPAMAIADLVREIKTATSVFIKANNWTSAKFEWQAGYGAFSYSRSHIDQVIRYILNQEQHHAKKSFKDEYTSILKNFGIDYKEAFLFDWLT